MSVRGSAEVRESESARGNHSRTLGLSHLRTLLFVICLLPLANLIFDGFTGGLEAEPVKDITHRTGWWALTLLLLTLAITPIRKLSGWNHVIKLRKTLGLFAFFYASIHLLIYFGLDQAFSFAYIGEDIIKRPYITVGFTALLLLVPLALTSNLKAIRRLGKRWQKLHRLIYLCAALGVLHFYWLVKADVREPLFFAAALAILLAFRLPLLQRKSAPTRAPRPARAGPLEKPQ
ncbi:MAG: sulfoxide reductase heme-binding subunit YedZ [Gemmatimonadetes bacterium]|nr:sulfoxide reductase heme-binding subunit YedZ [Gemmatimonadota bacterium]